MLIIGRTGSIQMEQGNTLAALNASVQTGVDILELAVSITKDDIPIVVHAPHGSKNHPNLSTISRSTFSQLYERFTECPIVPLSQVLDEFFSAVLLNIRLKGADTGKRVVAFLNDGYITKKGDWDALILSSVYWRELAAARKASPDVNLALLHSQNPFLFTLHYRHLRLAAVGFHRLHLNSFALEIAKRTGLFTYIYTVNRPETAVKLARKGVDGIVTDRPESIAKELSKQSSGGL